MSIVSLFCKTDDSFLAYEAYLAPHSLEDGKPVVVGEVYIPAR